MVPLTAAEIARIREGYAHEVRLSGRALGVTAVIGDLLATIDALIEDGNRLHSVAAQSDMREHPYVDDWRRLVMDCA